MWVGYERQMNFRKQNTYDVCFKKQIMNSWRSHRLCLYIYRCLKVGELKIY